MSDPIKRLLPLLLESKGLNENGIRLLQTAHAGIKRKNKSDRTDEDWFVMGYYALQTGQYDEAVSAFSDSIFENEEFEAAFRFRASAYMDSKRYDEAAKDLDEALRLDPSYIDAQFERVRLLYEMDKDADAVAAAKAFTEANPSMPTDSPSWAASWRKADIMRRPFQPSTVPSSSKTTTDSSTRSGAWRITSRVNRTWHCPIF